MCLDARERLLKVNTISTDRGFIERVRVRVLHFNCVHHQTTSERCMTQSVSVDIFVCIVELEVALLLLL